MDSTMATDRPNPLTRTGRQVRVERAFPAAAGLPTRLVELALAGLPRMTAPDGGAAYTLRRTHGPGGPRVRAEGSSARYGWIVLLGAARLEPVAQKALLSMSARQRATLGAGALHEGSELGELALATWAASETGIDGAQALADLLVRRLETDRGAATVIAAWSLTALVAAGRLDDAARARDGLLAAAGPSGLFHHTVRPATQRWHRRHVGCFADQVYPIQALARFAAASGDELCLARAQGCADRICDLQGESGQWWWHYDARTGEVVEGFPVYSVHQASMAPMALLDLEEAGGDGHLDAVGRGLTWLTAPPETGEALIDEAEGVVWRKVGRREPVRKGVRALRSAGTALHPGWRLRAVDPLFPPGVVDHETRPYELGWILMTWLTNGP